MISNKLDGFAGSRRCGEGTQEKTQAHGRIRGATLDSQEAGTTEERVRFCLFIF